VATKTPPDTLPPFKGGTERGNEPRGDERGVTSDPPRLIGGPYRPPRGRSHRVGAVAACRVRGEVTVHGISDAPIPWPTARTNPHAHPLPICTPELERAIRTESVRAVVHWWGMSRWAVRRWRHALGVERFNPGTMALWRELAPSKLTDDARAKARAAYQRFVRRRRRLRDRPRLPAG